MAKTRGAKKRRSGKHGSSCKCPECSKTRSQKRTARRQASLRRWQIRKGLQLSKPKSKPGFFDGGHQQLKRLFNVSDSAPTHYHTKALSYYRSTQKAIAKHAKSDGFDISYYLHRIYQVNVDPQEFESFGGEVSILWHGTGWQNISSIGHMGFRAGRYGLLGGGVYVSPDFVKSWNFSRGPWYGSKNYKTVILAGVKLGKVWNTQDTKIKITGSTCQAEGYDTAFAGSGRHGSAWRGRLLYSEYCCYDARRVLPLYVLIFSSNPSDLRFGESR